MDESHRQTECQLRPDFCSDRQHRRTGLVAGPGNQSMCILRVRLQRVDRRTGHPVDGAPPGHELGPVLPKSRSASLVLVPRLEEWKVLPVGALWQGHLGEVGTGLGVPVGCRDRKEAMVTSVGEYVQKYGRTK